MDTYYHSSRSRGTPQRVTLTKEEIAQQHDRCGKALLAAGINPFVTGLFTTPAGLVEKPIPRTYAYDNGPDHFSFLKTRNWNSLPRADAKNGAKIAMLLRNLCRERPGIWMGVVNEDAVCTIKEVGQRRRKLMTKLRQFMVQQSRHHGVEHVFSVVQEPVRNRETGLLRTKENGELLYHVHTHFLFYPAPTKKKRERFEKRLRRRFGKGSGIERVLSETAVVTYLTAVQDRSDYLDHGEFVEWHKQIWRTPRCRIYGLLKPSLRKRKRNPTRSPQSPSGLPKLATTNQFMFKQYVGKKAFTVFDNLVDPIDKVYRDQCIEREPDL